MGLFSSIKELFNKNIECDADMNSHMVFLLKKKKFMYLNKNIIVRDGTQCVVVYKSRVADVILPGKYKITEQTIPETYRRAKVEKLNKHGAKIKRIRVDLYFVSTQEFKDFEFDSDEPFFLKSKELGRIKGYMKGSCTTKVIDAGLLVKCLINDTGKEKTEDVHTDVGLWIGNKINKKIEKDKISIENILNNNDYIAKLLNTDLEDAYDYIGIFVKNIKLKAIDFPKRYQKKINEYIVHHKTSIKPSVVLSSLRGSESAVPVQNNNISSAQNSTMQNGRFMPNIATFKVCQKCGFKNHVGNRVCNNCSNRFDWFDYYAKFVLY